MKRITIGGKDIAPSKVVCVGKNYDAHIAEMGGKGRPAEPTIFIKPNSAIAYCPREILIPEELGLLHHEVELCCLMGEGKAIDAYAVGLDLTLRDLQKAAKKVGEPWALAKGFDNAAVIGEFLSAAEIADAGCCTISLSVNGEVRQQAATSEMIFSPAEILSYVSRYMTVEPGDIVMCGTPEGVGPLHHGDVLAAEIAGLPRLRITIRRS